MPRRSRCVLFMVRRIQCACADSMTTPDMPAAPQARGRHAGQLGEEDFSKVYGNAALGCCSQIQTLNTTQAGGAAALQTLLADALEEAKPEFLKQRPKYYYYNQWMRGRLAAACPALPEPVVLKMLDMEAGELDLVLQYPQAAAAQARLTNVLSFRSYKILLTWCCSTPRPPLHRQV